ncbi:MAG: addiction module protein [Verrucomicrobiota bacterium]
MEAIWADLIERVEQFEIPSEHEKLQDARRARVAAGESALQDWDAVKHNISRK